MSIDRRIVSILYYNGITDVNTVENFVGEHENYYEVVINGKLRKLKIPGYSYKENLVEDLTQKLNELGVLLNDITELNPETEEEKNLIKEIDDEFNKLESFSKKIKVEEPVVEEPVVEEPVVEEPVVEEPVVEEPVVEEPKKPIIKKNIKPKKEVKKIDNDIDDFINLA